MLGLLGGMVFTLPASICVPYKTSMIGITHTLNLILGGTASLKRDILFCGKVGLSDYFYAGLKGNEKLSEIQNQNIDEISFLLKSKYFDLTASILEAESKKVKYEDMVVDDLGNGFLIVKETGAKILADHEFKKALLLQKNTPASIQKFKKLTELDPFIIARSDCICISSFGGLQTVALGSIPELEENNGLQAGFKLAVSKVPVPSENTSWENIFDMLEDDELIASAARLRSWVREVTKENLGQSEINDRLEYLLYDYKKHMRVHTSKFSTSTLEIVVVGGTEFIENALQLKFSKAIGKLFSIRKSGIDLLGAEMEAPGRQVSLIAKLEKKFQDL